MTTSELKLKIFRQIDSLDGPRLEAFSGFLENFINGQRELDDWGKLTNEQQKGVLDAITQVETGKVIPHQTLVTKFRNKYSDA